MAYQQLAVLGFKTTSEEAIQWLMTRQLRSLAKKKGIDEYPWPLPLAEFSSGNPSPGYALWFKQQASASQPTAAAAQPTAPPKSTAPPTSTTLAARADLGPPNRSAEGTKTREVSDNFYIRKKA
ncbi:hypothetical protein CABS01_06777 [Colletotrichum abscissum]|uniref:Uncharacterized protein n=1 Tax=Colletotrichum abscissum TaxID=1671311 RepID=A0A9Q0B0E4_9PEZI|nr:uncharacterized protein CABS01_06777 [Colletotrichum abscissum]KAI3540889.1 hypothetical protein CABS02_10914 [Colletotrichum abscissum]KAK1514798.1 hypothetical protein CABS01_06777 [Colletotrichum abscissum]